MPAIGAGVVALVALTGVSGTGQPRTQSPVLRTDTIARVARERTPSVVFLHVLTRGALPAQPQLLPTPGREGLGSGVVIDASGSILTNAHVIQAADAIHVRTPDGHESDAIVIGTDPELDLALLRAPGLADLTAAPLGDSDGLNVGDWVVAIGSPFGLHHTVTAGIISAKARGIDHSGIEYLQTDAAINPGSSGGALLDLNGALVGITTAILAPAGDNIGLNFAIPINAVKEVLPQLHTGTVTHGWIGVKTWTLGRSGAGALGIDSGVVVVAVADDSPAARAGIRPGDVLLEISSPSPVAAADIQRRIRDMASGTTISLIVWRDQRRVEVEVTVGTRPPVR
ncbi:MAG TPA: trypsin-like peptidase domain-containing protein [Vicinamibacterales bacterium]|nr:trypsin-like peptidase domain-containing protein [Vicinamibacterales bacterium]